MRPISKDKELKCPFGAEDATEWNRKILKQKSLETVMDEKLKERKIHAFVLHQFMRDYKKTEIGPVYMCCVQSRVAFLQHRNKNSDVLFLFIISICTNAGF